MPHARSRPTVAYLTKRSAWSVFVDQGQDDHVRKLVARGDPTVARLRTSHDAHERTVEHVMEAFEELGVRAVEIGPTHRDLRSERFDLVVTVGGDGTLLRASHHVADVPVLGINSAPKSSIGFFCGAKNGEVHARVARALEGRLAKSELSRMQVSVNGKVAHRRVLNDALFCHVSPAATSRYLVELGKHAEEHKSSGFWIGPAAGSTAAQRSAGGKVLPLGSKALQLVVREPYTPQGNRYALLRKLVRPGERLVVRSKMRSAAIFLDGPDEVVHVAYGDVVEFTRSDQPLCLLGISPRRGRASW